MCTNKGGARVCDCLWLFGPFQQGQDPTVYQQGHGPIQRR